MAGSVNKAILVGRLGADAKLSHTGSGAAVVSFTLATDEGYRDKQGEWQKNTTWHRIVWFGKGAEAAQQYLTKGRLVFIDGRITHRTWTDREGQERQTSEIVASLVQLLDKGSGGQAGGGGHGQEKRQEMNEGYAGMDEVPF